MAKKRNQEKEAVSTASEKVVEEAVSAPATASETASGGNVVDVKTLTEKLVAIINAVKAIEIDAIPIIVALYEKPLSVKDLIITLYRSGIYISEPALRRRLNKLEKGGIITQTILETKGAVKIVEYTLTEEGRRLIENLARLL